MRFYTVPDARAARASVLYATGFIGYFYLIIPIVGFGASALVGRELIRKIDAGGNMAAPLVAELLGGTPFLGFIAAVAFATILAVVAGLTLAGASALSHDIFVHVVRKGHASEAEQVRVARIATVVFGAVAVLLGIAFRGQNVAFMVGLAFAIACSANFPPLLLSIVWRRFNTVGAVSSIVCGATLSVLLILGSPTVWVDLLGNAKPLFPLRNPAIISMTARVRRRHHRIAPHARAVGGSEVRRRKAAHLPRRRGRVGAWDMALGASAHGRMGTGAHGRTGTWVASGHGHGRHREGVEVHRAVPSPDVPMSSCPSRMSVVSGPRAGRPARFAARTPAAGPRPPIAGPARAGRSAPRTDPRRPAAAFATGRPAAGAVP